MPRSFKYIYSSRNKKSNTLFDFDLNTKGNWKTDKPEINYDKLDTLAGFCRELKKQIPGMTLATSTLWKYERIIKNAVKG